MRSLLISGMYFPPQVGGISHFFGSLADALGPERICCLTPVLAGEGQTEDGRYRVYRRPGAFTGGRVRQLAGFAAAMAEIALRERPRVVQLSTTYDAALGLLLHQTLGWPLLVYAHGNEVLDAVANDWAKPRQALKAAYRVVAVSRFTRDLVCRAGVDPERIEIVHPGCDVDRFTPRDRMAARRRVLGDTTAPVIITVGALVARKGHDMVIRALPALREQVPDVLYVVVGDGPYRGTLESLVAELGLGGHVRFAGKVPGADLPDYYAACDVFAMPSRAMEDQNDVEGFGLVFLEAAASGKPSVAGRSGGVGDAVVDGGTGILVNPEDPGDIASALGRLLLDQPMARMLGLAGRDRVTREFTWTAAADRVQRIAESAVAAGHPTHAGSASDQR